jgi:hypothetical protein
MSLPSESEMGEQNAADSGPKIRLAATSILIMLLFVPFALVIDQWERFGDFSDYGFHIAEARRLAEGVGPPPPHFLFHLSTVGLAKAIGSASYAGPGLFVAYLSQAAAGVCAFLLLLGACRARSWGNLAFLALLAASLGYVTPVTLLTIGERNLYLGYLPCANVYHNPTIVALKPWALLTMIASLRLLTRQTGSRGRTIRWSAATTAALAMATLAKPSFTMCFLPAYLVVSIHIFYQSGELKRVAGLLAPISMGSLILILQYAMFVEGRVESGLAFEPFALVSDPIGLVAMKYSLSLFFPLAVVIGFPRSSWEDIGLRLAWTSYLVALAVALLFVESGPHRLYGNLYWGVQICGFVLFVYSARHCVGQWAERHSPGMSRLAFRLRMILCAAAFGLHVASGVIWYVVFAVGPGGWVWY